MDYKAEIAKRDQDIHKCYINRESGEIIEENIVKEGMFNFFNKPGFGTFIGNVFFNSKLFHHLVKWYCERPISKPFIKKLIQVGNINENEVEYLTEDYKSLNEFFCRRLKPGCRSIEVDEDIFISPGDGKLFVKTITDADQVVIIKGVRIAIKDLIFSKSLADRYLGGQIAILRLYLGDYHRFHFPVSGFALASAEFPGSFYPVSPFQTNRSEFYLKNHRIRAELLTKNFGRIVTVMIGGFLISSIQLSYNPGNVRKGDEQGYFAFGGSTLVWLSEKGAVFYDDDINENSQKEIETYVKLGTQIGRSYI